MFMQLRGDCKGLSFIFVQRLVVWDSLVFQSPATAQTQMLGVILKQDYCCNYADDKISDTKHN